MFGMGCFWYAEHRFWSIKGVYTTASGYAGGYTPNPIYREISTGLTGHNEVVLVVFDPTIVKYEDLLKVFWENHDPTQGMRQGYDVGTQYRSGIYCYSDAQRNAAEASREAYQKVLGEGARWAITTEIMDAPEFYYAEDYHQQYLAKNPNGYCGIGGTVRLLTEYAGAERAVLALARDGSMRVQTEFLVDPERLEMNLDEAVDASPPGCPRCSYIARRAGASRWCSNRSPTNPARRTAT